MTRNPLVWLNIGITAGLVVVGTTGVAVANAPDVAALAHVMDVNVVNDAAHAVPVTVSNVVLTESTRAPFRGYLTSDETIFENTSDRWIEVEYANILCSEVDVVALRTVEGEMGLLHMYVLDLALRSNGSYGTSETVVIHIPPGAFLQFIDGGEDASCLVQVSGHYE